MIKDILIVLLLVGAISVATAFGISYAWHKNSNEPPLGGGNEPGEATSTQQITGVDCKTSNLHWLVRGGYYGSTILESVTVVSTTPFSLEIVNATTTTGTSYNGASSTVAVLPADLPQGTYEFNTWLDKGLVLQFQNGFCGDYIFTYR